MAKLDITEGNEPNKLALYKNPHKVKALTQSPK